MKVLTVLGTRPEIIRLSLIIPKLDAACDHVLVHTGQNFDDRLSEIFFSDLGVRKPDHMLGIRGDSPAEQIGRIVIESERILHRERPDRLLILGDTNSGLAAIMAKRLGIPVYHMEAGNRCFDDRVPEEVNRRIIDHCSDVWMPYTERSRENLLREGIPAQRIHVTGNPIHEVMLHHRERIAGSRILADLELEPRRYMLVTMHRAENVDVPARLAGLLTALDTLQEDYQMPVIVSTHPRTRSRLGTGPAGDGDGSAGARREGPAGAGAVPHGTREGSAGGTGAPREGVRFLPPFGFFDFVHLEQNARCVLSDSGTVQEECSILGVPNVTLRDVTERPETIECGSNVLAGADPEAIRRAVRLVLASEPRWEAPPEYRVRCVSDTVVRVVLGYR